MNIFEELGEKKSIFKCKKYLDHRFLPDYLPHRDEQIKSVAKYWIESIAGIPCRTEIGHDSGRDLQAALLSDTGGVRRRCALSASSLHAFSPGPRGPS